MSSARRRRRELLKRQAANRSKPHAASAANVPHTGDVGDPSLPSDERSEERFRAPMSGGSTAANRITANRANAARSTGPRTEAGTVRSGSTAANQAIARSRWNALTHGLYARTLTPAANLLEENLAEFQSLREALLEEYTPEGLAEERMIEKMALLCWQHDRLVACSEQRLAARLKAGDDIVTALIGREATTMAESRLDRAISRIHRDLLFLARYRERNREADAKKQASAQDAKMDHAAMPETPTPESPEPEAAREAEACSAGSLGASTPQAESLVERGDWKENDGTKPNIRQPAPNIASAA